MKIRWVSRAFFVVAISACAVDDTAGPPQLGAPIPGYTAATLEGDSVSLSSLQGEVVLLNLWATWCAPCRKETPFLQELFEEHQEDGLHLVGVSLDTGAATEQVERFVEDYGSPIRSSMTPKIGPWSFIGSWVFRLRSLSIETECSAGCVMAQLEKLTRSFYLSLRTL